MIFRKEENLNIEKRRKEGNIVETEVLREDNLFLHTEFEGKKEKLKKLNNKKWETTRSIISSRFRKVKRIMLRNYSVRRRKLDCFSAIWEEKTS